MQKYWDSQAAPVCVMQKTHGEEPSSWFISVIFQCMKKGLRPNGYFPLTRQPLQTVYRAFGIPCFFHRLSNRVLFLI